MGSKIAQEIVKKASHIVVLVCLSVLGSQALGKPSGAKTKTAGMGRLSQEQRQQRLDHAKELLGPHYKKSVVRTGETVAKVNGSIYRWTRASLPAKHASKADKVAQTIIDEAHKNGFDPIFVMSIIQTESTFNPDARGGVGEIGLMQIRPETGEWMAKKVGLPWKGEKSLKDPVSNVRIGVAYLAFLRESFDSHARLYLAAYNMGQSNVRELREKEKWPSEYPTRVMSVYVDYYNQLKEKSQASERSISSTDKT